MIKIYLPREIRDKTSKRIGLDSYPRIEPIDIQYIFHGTENPIIEMDHGFVSHNINRKKK